MEPFDTMQAEYDAALPDWASAEDDEEWDPADIDPELQERTWPGNRL